MNKPWLGYLSSLFLLMAGVLMIVGDKLLLGCMFIGLSILGLILKAIMNRKQ